MPHSSERLGSFCSGFHNSSDIVSWDLFDGEIDAEKEQKQLRKEEQQTFARLHRWYERNDVNLSLLSDPVIA